MLVLFRWYHWKADELKRVNPSALVPTLIPIGVDGKPSEDKVCVSFLLQYVFNIGSKDRLQLQDLILCKTAERI